MPVQNELSKQNIQDRYHGRNDPVARKILSTHATNMGLQPPEDQNIVCLFSPILPLRHCSFLFKTSLFLTSLPAASTEESLRTQVLKSLPAIQPAQLKSIVHVTKTRHVYPSSMLHEILTILDRCAFVNWKDRASAELAAQAWANGLEVDGEMVTVRWGRSKGASGPKFTKVDPSSVSESAL